MLGMVCTRLNLWCWGPRRGQFRLDRSPGVCGTWSVTHREVVPPARRGSGKGPPTSWRTRRGIWDASGAIPRFIAPWEPPSAWMSVSPPRSKSPTIAPLLARMHRSHPKASGRESLLSTARWHRSPLSASISAMHYHCETARAPLLILAEQEWKRCGMRLKLLPPIHVRPAARNHDWGRSGLGHG